MFKETAVRHRLKRFPAKLKVLRLCNTCYVIGLWISEDVTVRRSLPNVCFVRSSVAKGLRLEGLVFAQHFLFVSSVDRRSVWTIGFFLFQRYRRLSLDYGFEVDLCWGFVFKICFRNSLFEFGPWLLFVSLGFQCSWYILL